MKNMKTTLLGLSIGTIFAVLVLGTAFETAEAKPNALGKPDFIAKLNESGLSSSDSDAVGQAQLWFDEDEGGDLTLKYAIMLHKMYFDEEGQNGASDELLTKIHVHFAPNGNHSPMHLFNILGPDNDTNDRVIVETPGNLMIFGEWDKDDPLACTPEMEHFEHNSKTFDCVIPVENGAEIEGNDMTVLENLCSGQTDLNIHSDTFSSGSINGILIPKSSACDKLLD